jgi:hypothetical protein
MGKFADTLITAPSWQIFLTTVNVPPYFINLMVLPPFIALRLGCGLSVFNYASIHRQVLGKMVGNFFDDHGQAAVKSSIKIAWHERCI